MAVPQPHWSRSQDFFRDEPATKIIILLWVIVFIGDLITNRLLSSLLLFSPVIIPNAITGLLTYSLIPGGIIALIFGGIIMYQFGGSLERSWGTRTYLLFLLATNISMAVVWVLGVWLLGMLLSVFGVSGPTVSSIALGSLWPMLSAIIVAWAWLNPEEQVLFYFLFPMKAKWLGWASIAMLYVLGTPVGGLLLLIYGPFFLGGVAFAAYYVWYRRKWGWVVRRRQENKAAAAPSRRVLRHPSSTPLGAFLRPFREWQRKRRIAHLQRTFNFEDEEKNRGAG